MRYSLVTLAVASLAVAADQQGGEVSSQCQAAFKQCLLGGGSIYTCQCDLAECTGSTDPSIKQYCAAQHGSSSGMAPPPYAQSSSHAMASSSSYAVPSASSVAGAQGAQGGQGGEVPINAAPGTIGLGAACSTNEQCQGGAQCWGHAQNSESNAQNRRCGNTNAHCTTNAHCAFNTCNQGMCSGYLSGGMQQQPASSSRPVPGVAPTGVMPPGRAPNGTVPIQPYNGSASVTGIMSGFAAIFFGVVAWLL